MKILLLAVIVILCAGALSAQTGNTLTLFFPGVPSGSCAPLMLGLNMATGGLYDCLSGAWNLVGGGGGSSFSWTNGATGRICYYVDATHCDGDADFTFSPSLSQVTMNRTNSTDFAGLVFPIPSLSVNLDNATQQSSFGSFYGIYSTVNQSYPGVSAEEGFGIYGSSSYSGSISVVADNDGNSGVVGEAKILDSAAAIFTVGTTGRAYGRGTSTVERLVGVYADVFADGTSTILNAIGVEVNSYWTTPNITNAFGLKIANVSGAVNNYAIKTGTGLNDFGDRVRAVSFGTATNCADSAGAAACGSAAAGAFVVDAGGTSTVVSTTAVTANSEILVFFDASLSTRLGITCNSTVPGLYGVTARTAGTSFTLTASAPVTNPACFNFWVIN